jgi:pimeloyl-ACP methyl ester carboxylesterase
LKLKWPKAVAASAVLAAAITIYIASRPRQIGPSGAEPAVVVENLAPDSTLESLGLGQLNLKPCAIGKHLSDGVETVSAFCTRFSVPEDWDAPAGRHIDLKVAVVASDAAAPEPDMVTFLDGGPGGAATDDYPLVAAAFEPLRQHHRVLLIDQRGTGGSNALACPHLRKGTPGLDQTGSKDDEATALARIKQCLASLQPVADVAHYSTTDAAHDLEAVRRALGAPPLDVIGISYGTRLAQQYAARYPQAVRALVLDSPVPNRLALVSEHARNLERAVHALLDACSSQPACAQRYGDPYQSLYRLRDALRAHPQSVDVRDPISFAPLHLTLTADDLASIVRLYAYNPASAALLPLMLQQAEHGNYAPLLGQKKLLTDDLPSHINSGMELSVLCAEDADLLSPRPEDEGTLLGNRMVTLVRSACQFWPHEQRPPDFHTALTTSLPTLVLSGQLDPVTPPEYGTEIVAHLGNARLLVAPGQGHGITPVGCTPQLLQRFIQEPKPAALDAQCLERLGKIPPFLDYNGPEP